MTNDTTHKFKDCNICGLDSPKSIGWGNPKAKIMFVGINPADSISEDRMAFQASSFKVFFQVLKELGKNPKDYYYTNLIKCSTPKNRKPTKSEILNCSEFIESELSKINPIKVICFGAVVGGNFDISKMYTGKKPFKLNDRVYYLFPHPSYIRRFPREYEKFKKYLGMVLK